VQRKGAARQWRGSRGCQSPNRAPQAKAEGFGGDAIPPKGSGVSPAIMASAAKKLSSWIKLLHIFYSKPYIHVLHVLTTFYALALDVWEWQDYVNTSNSALGGVCSTSLYVLGHDACKIHHAHGVWVCVVWCLRVGLLIHCMVYALRRLYLPFYFTFLLYLQFPSSCCTYTRTSG